MALLLQDDSSVAMDLDSVDLSDVGFSFGNFTDAGLSDTDPHVLTAGMQFGPDDASCVDPWGILHCSSHHSTLISSRCCGPMNPPPQTFLPQQGQQQQQEQQQQQQQSLDQRVMRCQSAQASSSCVPLARTRSNIRQQTTCNRSPHLNRQMLGRLGLLLPQDPPDAPQKPVPGLSRLDSFDVASEISCNSTCPDTCPSHCGTPGQGVYCDDDDCADQLACPDKDCAKPCQPCDPCPPCPPCLPCQPCPPSCQPYRQYRHCAASECHNPDSLEAVISESADISYGDRQAAAALASFGTPSEPIAPFFLNQVPTRNQDHDQSHGQNQNQDRDKDGGQDRDRDPIHGQLQIQNRQDDLFFDTTSDQVQDPSCVFIGPVYDQNGRFHFVSLPEVSSSADSSSLQTTSLHWGAEDRAFTDSLLPNHILEYHCLQNRPCPVDHQDFQPSRCSLPRVLSGVDKYGNPYFHHLNGPRCGYEVDTVNQFALHVLADHIPSQTTADAALGAPSSSALTYQPGLPSFESFMQPDQILLMPPPGSLLAGAPRLSSSAASADLTCSATGSPASHLPSAQTSPETLAVDKASVEPTRLESSAAKGEKEGVFECRWRIGDGDEICGQVFDSADKLHLHGKHDHTSVLQKTESGFQCAWSGCTRSDTFNQRSKLDRHLQTHTGFKPVQCPNCKEFFSAKQALVQHMRLHTGEEPWRCRHPGCTRTFKQQSALTMHERTHTGERPLSCDICFKTFAESSNLSKHRRIHNEHGNYVCTVCNKDFHRHDQLRRHATRKHAATHPEQVELMIKRPRKTRHGSEAHSSVAVEL